MLILGIPKSLLRFKIGIKIRKIIVGQAAGAQNFRIQLDRGAATPRPPSFAATSTAYGDRLKSVGANQVSLLTLPQKQVQVLLKLQVGDPDEELDSALVGSLAALELDQSAFLFADVSCVQCSLGPPPSESTFEQEIAAS